MQNIEDYIKLASSMPNISDGGSAAYNFGDVVLVKYTNLIKYAQSGKARECEEEVMAYANALAAEGVNTPKHLAIKRTTEGDKYVCWVLQESAPGVCFKNYTSPKNKGDRVALQTKIATAPEAHYEKLVKDIIALFNMGIELKPKNIFYSEDKENGGFTIIDLLGKHGEPFNPNKIADINRLYNYVLSVFCQLKISSYSDDYSQIEKQLSSALYNHIQLKILNAMEKVIPNFNKHRRWLLRTLDSDTLTHLAENDATVGNLTLTKQEEQTFNLYINKLLDECIKSVKSGESKYWQVCANLISNGLRSATLIDAWKYHKGNKNLAAGEALLFGDEPEDSYETQWAQERELIDLVTEMFNKKLAELAASSQNPHVQEAFADMQAEQASTIRNKK